MYSSWRWRQPKRPLSASQPRRWTRRRPLSSHCRGSLCWKQTGTGSKRKPHNDLPLHVPCRTRSRNQPTVERESSMKTCEWKKWAGSCATKREIQPTTSTTTRQQYIGGPPELVAGTSPHTATRTTGDCQKGLHVTSLCDEKKRNNRHEPAVAHTRVPRGLNRKYWNEHYK